MNGVWIIFDDTEVIGVCKNSDDAYIEVSNLVLSKCGNSDQLQEILLNSFSLGDDSFGCLNFYAVYAEFL